MSRACGAVIADRFTGGEVKNLLLNYFEDSNEGIVSREEQRTKTCEIPVKLLMNDGATKTVECMWVNFWYMLDWIIGFCHKNAEIHFLGTSCSTGECTK